MKSVFLRALLSFGLVATLVHADPNLGFTAFAGANLSPLANGQVLQARGGLIEFERGVTAQSLYFIAQPPQAVEQKLEAWDPANHSELDVWLHAALPLNPTLADFSALSSLPDNKSVNNMVAATYNYTPGSDSLQVNSAEAALIATGHGQSQSKQFVVDVWSKILDGRVEAFLKNQLGDAKYVANSATIYPFAECKALLRSDPKIFGEFHPMLKNTPVYNGSGLKPSNLYYECFDIEGEACFGTGAVYLANPPGTTLRADVEYYVSNGIYTSVELEQLWPMTIDGKSGTLIWRADMVSTANVAYLHGTERLASGMLMLQDVKQAVDAFRAEFR
jgi:hypothetical protein